MRLFINFSFMLVHTEMSALKAKSNGVQIRQTPCPLDYLTELKVRSPEARELIDSALLRAERSVEILSPNVVTAILPDNLASLTTTKIVRQLRIKPTEIWRRSRVTQL